MLFVGICGTDLHAVRADPRSGYIVGSAPLEVGASGRILGHEGVGRVVEVGEGVTGLSVDTVVTFESLLACHACATCRRGQFNHCYNARLIGGQVDGLFREVVDVPARAVHDVSDLACSAEGLRAAACIEPAACAHVAAVRAEVAPGSRVVVFGGGPIGIFAAMLCREGFGASVDVVEPVPFRRQLAATWCDRVYDVGEFFADARRDSIDVVLEASGDLRNIERVLERLTPCARVALLARSGKPLRLPHVDQLITGGISIFGSRGHLGGAFDDVLRLVRSGRLPLHAAVTGVVDGLEDLRHELEADDRFEHRHAKVLARLADGVC
jgi:threonine dehydrogenase-like Zn-dependent dehydrogenase